MLTDQTICTGEAPNALTLNGASPISATTSYQWQRSDDNISWANIAGQNAANETSTVNAIKMAASLTRK